MTAAYIALEGPDGVGKSTVAEELKALLLLHPDPAPYARVRIRHFPTRTLAQCAKKDGRAPTAEDYAMDMENWLSFRPEPVLFPDAPGAAQPETLYILDRWALSTEVYASLRGESAPLRTRPTLGWLHRIPLTTFVLMPKTPEALTDPDYPDPDGYDPRKVTEAYRGFLAEAFVSGCFSRFVPIVVDRARDTPGSVAADIVERLTVMGALRCTP